MARQYDARRLQRRAQGAAAEPNPQHGLAAARSTTSGVWRVEIWRKRVAEARSTTDGARGVEIRRRCGRGQMGGGGARDEWDEGDGDDQDGTATSNSCTNSDHRRALHQL